ncbi:MAG: ABC transporter, permease protein (cluster 9, phospholipid), partial [uncultured Ramlibacter sp.]
DLGSLLVPQAGPHQRGPAALAGELGRCAVLRRGPAGAGAVALQLRQPGHAAGVGAPYLARHRADPDRLHHALGAAHGRAHAHRRGHRPQLRPFAVRAGDGDPGPGAGTDPADRRALRRLALHHPEWRRHRRDAAQRPFRCAAAFRRGSGGQGGLAAHARRGVLDDHAGRPELLRRHRARLLGGVWPDPGGAAGLHPHVRPRVQSVRGDDLHDQDAVLQPGGRHHPDGIRRQRHRQPQLARERGPPGAGAHVRRAAAAGSAVAGRQLLL